MSVVSAFHQERPFEAIFGDAHQRMTTGRGAYLITMQETAGVTHNVFDYDAANHRYRHFKLSIDPSKPLNMENGSMEAMQYYTCADINKFRYDMMLTTLNALQNQSVQYYRPGNEPQIENTGFPIARITYTRDMKPLPPMCNCCVKPSHVVLPQPSRSQKKMTSSKWLFLLVVLISLGFVVAALYTRNGWYLAGALPIVPP